MGRRGGDRGVARVMGRGVWRGGGEGTQVGWGWIWVYGGRNARTVWPPLGE